MSFSAEALQRSSADQMAGRVEGVVDRRLGRQEPLRRSLGLESLLLPLVLFGLQLRHEIQILVSWLEEVRRNGLAAPDWLPQIPFVGAAADDWWHDNLAGPQRAASFLGHLNRGDIVAVGQNVGEQLIRRTVTFTFTIVTLFFLFRAGESISASLLYVGRQLFGPRGQQLSRQIAASIHGTVDGLVIVGLGEGLVLGIAYYLAGVPNATLFGAATAVAAIIPFGAPLLFTVVSILLLLQGAKIAAVVIFAFGLLVMAIADHVVRPVVIGGATRLPFLWVLLGILGGVETWGLIGLFLGPAIMAVLILLWREWTVPPEST